MSRNKNIGRGTLANNGLILQAKPKVTTSDAGLREATLIFHVRDDKAKLLQPARRTKCSDFVAGSPRTAQLLADLDFLACQTADYTLSGVAPGKNGAPGIALMEVHCQGAIFDLGTSAAPVAAVNLTNRGFAHLGLSAPGIDFSGGGEITPAWVVTRLRAIACEITAGGAGYVDGDVLTLVGGSFDHPVLIRVNTAGTGGSIKTTDGGVTVIIDYGGYLSVVSGTYSFSGGTGTGATAVLTWQLADPIVLDGGQYASTPTAVFSNLGTFDIDPILGSVELGDNQIVGGDLLTTPFAPVTLVKDTTELELVNAVAPPASTFAARAIGSISYNGIIVSGRRRIGIVSPWTDGRMPPVNGIGLNANDRFVLNDGTSFAGIYKVITPGTHSTAWYATETAKQPVVNDTIGVSEGSDAGQWNCTGISPSIFAKVDPGETTTTTKVTIEYRAIELSFEYMARYFSDSPRYLEDEYHLDGNGKIIIDPVNNSTMALKIISVLATASDGTAVAIDEATWRAAVKYIGDASQFEQIPAGAIRHVTETATIRIVQQLALNPAPVATTPPRFPADHGLWQ